MTLEQEVRRDLRDIQAVTGRYEETVFVPPAHQFPHVPTGIDVSRPKVLAIIPARSGSVGVKHKNVRMLGDKPLMAWAIRAATASILVSRVVVDTDNEEYAKIARQYGAETPYLRPKELAEDVPTEDVLIHALGKLGYDPDVLVCIQCTTPFVRPKDIDDCVGSVLFRKSLSAITVAEVTERPEWMFKRDLLTDLIWLNQGRQDGGEVLKGSWGVRQTFGKLYRPNGGAYAIKTSKLLEGRQLIQPPCLGVLMDRIRSIDVDTEEDFMLLEALVKAGFP